MAKRIDAARTPRLVVLHGKWIILAHEHGNVWINKMFYESRGEADCYAGKGLPANVFGWEKLGPSPRASTNDGVAHAGHSTKAVQTTHKEK